MTYCRFVDNRNGKLCERIDTKYDDDITNNGPIGYEWLCEKHRKYIKIWMKKRNTHMSWNRMYK
jgi:hypothetical protein